MENEVAPKRFDLYRRLSERLGGTAARPLIDRLQVLALTQPDILREMEEFLDRSQPVSEKVPIEPARDLPSD